MSVAIRKRSWEEHVTQRMGQPFNTDDCNTACHHGLVADNLQASMEKDASLNVDRKEKCVSLPDCCHGSELGDFPGRSMGHISKKMNENDSNESEDEFLSLEASTETLVHLSDEDTNSDLYPTDNKQILTSQGHKISGHHSVEGACSLVNTLPIMESSHDSYSSWGIAGKDDLALAGENGERKVVDTVSKSLELCDDINLSEIKDMPKVNTFDSLDVKDIAPEKQLVNSAVIAQQRRKPDFPEDEHEKNMCHELQDEVLPIPCTDGRLPLLKADFGSCLQQPPSTTSGAENGLEKSGFSEHQNKGPPEVNADDGVQCFPVKDTLDTQEPTDCQVRLRKRKEIREDRDRVRLDSMVLLIMKLDQLDQDIENALSTSSSPSGTPTNLRRQVPDMASGTENGADMISANQMQANLSSSTESTDLPSSTSVTNSGTKSKAMVSCK
ncbi:Rho GTPase-activating protein 7 [Heterocephalus glaber]|uniref:Rho GTPase-activating protein 7 n=1 Tax=Heterocephalus glaber TaxID=10181 RepID=G5ANI9_HETGA|nr:Rho GTPase-activating protein 7 [Heterocephalus glaber]